MNAVFIISFFFFSFLTQSSLAAIAKPLPEAVKASHVAVAKLKARKTSDAASRIVGGINAVAGSYPWMVSIQDLNNFHYCGGSLIAPDWVLTAAHCMVGGIASQTQVVVGANQLSTVLPSQRIAVNAIHVHPNYDSANNDNDIALLHLSQTAVAAPLSLADPLMMAQLPPATLMRVIGWGTLTQGGVSPDILQQVDLPLVDFAVCNGVYGNTLTANMICAGVLQGGVDSCQGDSGGPLFVQQNGIWYQTGVVSFGNGCASPSAYGVYSSVVQYRNWITAVMEGVNLETVNFGAQPLGAISTHTVTLQNNGASSLTVQSFILSDPSFFILNETCSAAPVVAGGSCIFSIGVNHAVVGDQVALLTVNTTLAGVVLLVTSQISGEVVSPLTFVLPPDALGLSWFSGVSRWIEDVTMIGPDGISPSLRSGGILDAQSSTLMTQVSGTGTLSFNWKISSEAGFDFLIVYLDGQEVSRISGVTAWQARAISVPVGIHNVSWKYVKDGSISNGLDAGWVSQVSWLAGNVFALHGWILPLTSFTPALNVLPWYADPVMPWSVDPVVLGANGLSESLRSGLITHNQSSILATEVSGPTTFNFNWQVDSEAGFDFLISYLDGVEVARISGIQSWAAQSITVPTGSHKISWIYQKDANASTGQDRGWISFDALSAPVVVDGTAPVIALQGQSPVSLNQGTAYVDAGATATDNVDPAVTVVVTGAVNSNVVGSYTLSYDASDAAGNGAVTVTRVVNVVDGSAPVIALQGQSPVSLNQGTAYVDAGATATDNVDPAVTVVVTGSVNSDVVGSYTLSYDASDAAGNVAVTVTRVVNVVDGSVPVIALQGQSPVSLNQGTAYVDAGATATDNVDPAVTVVVTGSVNSNVVGSYTLSYDASDAAGNVAATVTRVVNVVLVASTPDAPTSSTTSGSSSGGGGGSLGAVMLLSLLGAALGRRKMYAKV